MSTPQDRIPRPLPSDVTTVNRRREGESNVGWREFVRQFLPIPEALKDVVLPDTEEARRRDARREISETIPYNEQFPHLSEQREAEIDRLFDIRQQGHGTISPVELSPVQSLIQQYVPPEIRQFITAKKEEPLNRAIAGAAQIIGVTEPTSMIEGPVAKAGQAMGIAAKLAENTISLDKLMKNVIHGPISETVALKILQKDFPTMSPDFLQNLKSLYQHGIGIEDLKKATNLDWDVGVTGGVFKAEHPGGTEYIAPVDKSAFPDDDKYGIGNFLVSGAPEDRIFNTVDDIAAYFKEMGVAPNVKNLVPMPPSGGGETTLWEYGDNSIAKISGTNKYYIYTGSESSKAYNSLEEATNAIDSGTIEKLKAKFQLLPMNKADSYFYGGYTIEPDFPGGYVLKKQGSTVDGPFGSVEGAQKAIDSGTVKAFAPAGTGGTVPYKSKHILTGQDGKFHILDEDFKYSQAAGAFDSFEDAKTYLDNVYPAPKYTPKYPDPQKVPVASAYKDKIDVWSYKSPDAEYHIEKAKAVNDLPEEFNVVDITDPNIGPVYKSTFKTMDEAVAYIDNIKTKTVGEIQEEKMGKALFGEDYAPAPAKLKVFDNESLEELSGLVWYNSVFTSEAKTTKVAPGVHITIEKGQSGTFYVGSSNFNDDSKAFDTIEEAGEYVQELVGKYKKTSSAPKGWSSIGEVLGDIDAYSTPYKGKNIKLDDNGYYYVLNDDGSLVTTHGFTQYENAKGYVDGLAPSLLNYTPTTPALGGSIDDYTIDVDFFGGYAVKGPDGEILEDSPSFVSRKNAEDWIKNNIGGPGDINKLASPQYQLHDEIIETSEILPDPPGQTGSNDANWYLTNGGTKFYGKFPIEANHAKTELLANEIYRTFGKGGGTIVPDTYIFNTNRGDGVGHASVYAGDNWKSLPRENGASAVSEMAARRFLENAHLDLLLLNWDVVSYNFTNLLYDEAAQRLLRVDNGSSLLYRARGAKKPDIALESDGIEVDWIKFFRPESGYGEIAKRAGVTKFEDLGMEFYDNVMSLKDNWSSYVNKMFPNWTDEDKFRTIELLNNRTRAMKEKVRNLPRTNLLDRIPDQSQNEVKGFFGDESWPAWQRIFKLDLDTKSYSATDESVFRHFINNEARGADPEFMYIRDTLHDWYSSSKNIRGEMALLLGIQTDKYSPSGAMYGSLSPEAASRGAVGIINAIARETPTSPMLWRGRGVSHSNVEQMENLKVGDMYELLPASFSSDKETGFKWASGGVINVVLEIPENSRALKVDNLSSHTEYEWITGGKFRVVKERVEMNPYHPSEQVRVLTLKQEEVFRVSERK